MNKQYVEQSNDGYFVTGSRISLESVIFAFLEGFSPETIAAECFPTLSLEQVYGTITYYLSNRKNLDVYLQKVENDWQEAQNRYHDPEFSRKMNQVRRELQLARQ